MGSVHDFYKPEERVFHDDGREEKLLEFINAHPKRLQMQNSPEAVLQAIDEYGRTHDFLMTVGKYKGKQVVDLIAGEKVLDFLPGKKPKTVLEIGCYVGYSAILFGNALRQAGGEKYRCLEVSEKFAAVARPLIDIAGLGDFVEITVGPCRDSLRSLPREPWDLVFLDHAKVSYLNDLKLCEELDIVAPGTIIVADDMVRPGNPPYSKYVRQAPVEKRREYEPFADGVKDPVVSLGNPSLIYQTGVLEGLQPTGDKDSVEVSYCEKVETA